ncbi:O-acetylserine/cysteine export protein [Aliidongia dinghuensis]|uniref:O-acetylserine/cysteine export protein n=1 Tax=Aliidongia dinghuensis TaxID=1867774 RepID=A0A8J3E1C9_9PROT|nr:EamA family transporter [Aliidongia dinghuensis]GGE99823.1 O-acetylserine/cysteine export protein [Aliidongia dinghuensis]
MAPVKSSGRAVSIGAFALLCLAWGGTWLPLKHGVAHLPPLLFVGSRFLAGGLVLWLWAGRAAPPPRSALWPGAVLMVAANYGLMAWGAGRVPSGLAAMVNFATVPLAVLLLAGRRPSPGQTAALALGLAGLALLAWSAGRTMGGAAPAGLGAIALGAACYGLGTLRMKAAAAIGSPIRVAAWHSLAGGALLLMLSAATEPWDRAVWAQILDPAALASWALLVVLGTVIGFSLYLVLLGRWSAAAVASYAYVCPVVALALGALVDGERPGPSEIAACLVLMAAAALAILPHPQPKEIR